jgi:PcRGLX-like protein C-terminal alpha/alpha toroid domain/PcRGLX-like protein central beta sandwich domain/PcRGLX-like N-terminal RIFT barrel domain
MTPDNAWTRRSFLQRTVASGVGLPIAIAAHGTQPTAAQHPPLLVPGESPEPDVKGIPLRWMDGQNNSAFMGTTWGTAWPNGQVKSDSSFAVYDEQDKPVPAQNWILARWPDGTVKWSGHAIAPQATPSVHYSVRAGVAPTEPKMKVAVREDDAVIRINTGPLRCTLPRRGASLISKIERDGQPALTDGQLIALHQDQPSGADGQGQVKTTHFTSSIEVVTVEQTGPVRAVVKIDGKHTNPSTGRSWLPFSVRLYFYAGSDHVRIVHSFILDGDEHHDFISGLGVRFSVPMRDELYNRHMRFVSAEGGLWAEAIKGVTGLRRDPGEKVRRLQPLGKKLPSESTWDTRVTSRLHWIPNWGDVTLNQLSPDGFEINKRTKPGHGWIRSDGGTHAAGVGYVGGVSGGVAFGQRDFWQRYPVQLDIRDAASYTATVTMWLWSPQAKAMDLRFYHDGMGMNTYPKQIDGLEITYEDYEPGFGTPIGIARTTELNLWITAATPENQQLVDFAKDVMTPPILAASPQSLHRAQAFGPIWSLPDRSTPTLIKFEENLAFAFESYQTQQGQRRWYGFWDYGDIMHTYDPDRHTWRYDIGGYAWDNSELSPDLWLWYYFLRTGRADVFRFAEAMCRHTGEVDVYHLGKFAGLGSRHNVQHWGCSAKQLRISTVVYRRIFYYLTADERTGDLMDEQINCDQTFLKLDPLRKFRVEKYDPDPRALAIGTGKDWCSLALAWLTAWERRGDDALKQKLLNSMETLGQLKLGWFSTTAMFDPQTGMFTPIEGAKIQGVHLQAAFGLVEICAELIELFDVPDFTKKWLEFCTYYNAPREQRLKDLGVDVNTSGLAVTYSRLTAYAAWKTGDPAIAKRVWNEYFKTKTDGPAHDRINGLWAFKRETFSGVDSLNPVEETTWMNTNTTSQWGLATIQNLALVGHELPPNDPRVR